MGKHILLPMSASWLLSLQVRFSGPLVLLCAVNLVEADTVSMVAVEYLDGVAIGGT